MMGIDLIINSIKFKGEAGLDECESRKGPKKQNVRRHFHSQGHERTDPVPMQH